MDDDIYKQNILDHAKNPHHKGVLLKYDLMREGKNASCGDSLTLYFSFEHDMLKDVSFEGSGCAISLASASMLTDKIKGMTLEQLKLLTPGDIYTMLGIAVSPGRSKCALLAYGTLSEAISDYLQERNEDRGFVRERKTKNARLGLHRLNPGG
jgi:nitrogen fixation NifU-like protein